jgi:hypothetical protein
MAQPSNTNGIKLKESDVRQEAYAQYCAHIASGYPKEAFFFEHPTHSVCYKTMDKYIKENPIEFPPYLLNHAKSLRYKHWLNEGKKLMQGQYRHGSPIVWQTMMRNIFKDIEWDAPAQQSSISPESTEQLKHFERLLLDQREKV